MRPEPVDNGTGFDLEAYMTAGAERLVAQLLKSAVLHPREGKFLLDYAAASKKAGATRHRYEQEGTHIPSFLICSITSRCNLHCAGCYARSLSLCGEGPGEGQLSAEDWASVFSQARELGISFILLAGGEPMVRRDVLEAAGNYPELLFPVFTNGTLLTGELLELLDRKRNLIPIFSLEGGAATSDARRGSGVYRKVEEAMGALGQRRMLFGVSVTVTARNREEVMALPFISSLEKKGCKAVFFVEYVPTGENETDLAPDDACREAMAAQLAVLRRSLDMILLSFPGDEAAAGGCLAAGRGFFHINPYGGAEPCPFSPYSDANVRDLGLLGALRSPLFRSLQSSGMLLETHVGGCTLFEQRDKVSALLEEEAVHA